MEGRLVFALEAVDGMRVGEQLLGDNLARHMSEAPPRERKPLVFSGRWTKAGHGIKLVLVRL